MGPWWWMRSTLRAQAGDPADAEGFLCVSAQTWVLNGVADALMHKTATEDYPQI